MFKNFNRGISTSMAIGIIAVLVIVVGGGVLAYQRYYVAEKEQPNIQTPTIEIPTTEENEKPYITVLSPNGGEKFNEGQDIPITWTSEGINNVYIYAYYYDENNNIGIPGSSEEFSFNEGQCRLTYESVPASTGNYVVKNDGSGRCGKMPTGDRIKIQISGQTTDIKDISDNYFIIQK